MLPSHFNESKKYNINQVLYKGKHCILFVVSFMYIEKHVLVEYEHALKSIHIIKTMALWIVLLPVIR